MCNAPHPPWIRELCRHMLAYSPLAHAWEAVVHWPDCLSAGQLCCQCSNLEILLPFLRHLSAVQAKAPHNCEMHHDCGHWVVGWPASRGAGQDHRNDHSLEKHTSEVHCTQPRLQHRVGDVLGCFVPCQLQRAAGRRWQQPGTSSSCVSGRSPSCPLCFSRPQTGSWVNFHPPCAGAVLRSVCKRRRGVPYHGIPEREQHPRPAVIQVGTYLPYCGD